MDHLLDQLKNAIIQGDCDAAVEAAKEAIAAGIPPLEAIDQGANRGIGIVGEKFGRYEIYLPELVLGADAMNAALEVLLAALDPMEAADRKPATVVICTVSGDIHDIGKNLVAALLAVNGFTVHDLGVNVDVKQIVRRAREVKADIIALSTLLTTSLPFQGDVVQYLQDAGFRDKFFVIVGGGPVVPDWVTQIGADGWGRAAPQAVELCRRLMAGSRPPLSEPVIIDFEEKMQ